MRSSAELYGLKLIFVLQETHKLEKIRTSKEITKEEKEKKNPLNDTPPSVQFYTTENNDTSVHSIQFKKRNTIQCQITLLLVPTRFFFLFVWKLLVITMISS